MSVEKDREAEELNRTVNDHALSKRIATVGWGLFLVWIGIAMLAALPGGAGLLGIGVVALGIQAARAFFSLPLEGSWVVGGVIFTATGFVKMAGTNVPVLPLLLVAAGIFAVFLGIRGRGAGVARDPES